MPWHNEGIVNHYMRWLAVAALSRWCSAPDSAASTAPHITTEHHSTSSSKCDNIMFSPSHSARAPIWSMCALQFVTHFLRLRWRHWRCTNYHAPGLISARTSLGRWPRLMVRAQSGTTSNPWSLFYFFIFWGVKLLHMSYFYYISKLQQMRKNIFSWSRCAWETFRN
jgi:hypothetical protein